MSRWWKFGFDFLMRELLWQKDFSFPICQVFLFRTVMNHFQKLISMWVFFLTFLSFNRLILNIYFNIKSRRYPLNINQIIWQNFIALCGFFYSFFYVRTADEFIFAFSVEEYWFCRAIIQHFSITFVIQWIPFIMIFLLLFHFFPGILKLIVIISIINILFTISSQLRKV